MPASLTQQDVFFDILRTSKKDDANDAIDPAVTPVVTNGAPAA